MSKISEKTIIEINRQGHWRFPVKMGNDTANAILDDSFTFKQYCNNSDNWKSISDYIYTQKDMEAYWKGIEIDRINLKAAILVLEGKCIAMNPAIKHLLKMGEVPLHLTFYFK